MKYYLLLLLLEVLPALQAQTNRALVVTIGKYPHHSGWERLHSENDSILVNQMLTKHHYLAHDILYLSNEKATKALVSKAFIQLLQDTQAGDYIYLHFSCHGQQMMDDNGDEEDGLDESIVLYNATFWYTPGKYEGENHLRDDELGVWIDKLRRKVGEHGQVITVIDACHSGTGNRDQGNESYIRGTSAIFAPEGYIPQPGKNQRLSLLLTAKKNFSPAVVFSACLPEEVNYEYYDKVQSKYFGRLTFYFCKAVAQTNEEIKIDDFMSNLKYKLFSSFRGSKQTPYMECTSEDMILKIGNQKE